MIQSEVSYDNLAYGLTTYVSLYRYYLCSQMFQSEDLLSTSTLFQTVPLVKLSEQDPLLGISPIDEDTYLFYKKKIQVFGLDHKMNAEIILSEPLNCYYVAAGQVLLLYENGSLERRLVSDWQIVKIVDEPIFGVLSVRFYRSLIILKTPTALRVLNTCGNSATLAGQLELPYCEVKSECFSFSEEKDGVGCACLLFRDGGIRKYRFGGSGFEKFELVNSGSSAESRSIVDMFLVTFQQIGSSTPAEYVLTVDNRQTLELYPLSSAEKRPALVYRPANSTDLSIQRVLFEESCSRIWLQRDQMGISCVQFRMGIDPEEADSQHKFIESDVSYTGICKELFALAAQGLVLRDKHELEVVRLHNRVVNEPVSEQLKQGKGSKTAEELLEERQQIRQQIMKYSRRAAEDNSPGEQHEQPQQSEREQEYEDLASYLRVFSRLSVMEQFLKHFDSNAYQERLKLKHDNSELRAEVERLSDQLDRIIAERNDLTGQVTALEHHIEMCKSMNVLPARPEKAHTVDKTSSPAPELVECRSGVKEDKEIQTEEGVDDPQYSLSSHEVREWMAERLKGIEERLISESSKRYAQLEEELKSTKTELERVLTEKVERLVTKELSQGLRAQLSLMDRYFNLTLEKILEGFQQSLRHFESLSARDTMKMAEVSRELIDKNRSVIDRVVTVFKDSIVKTNVDIEQTKQSLEQSTRIVRSIDERTGKSLSTVASHKDQQEATFSRLVKSVEHIARDLEQAKKRGQEKRPKDRAEGISTQPAMVSHFLGAHQQPIAYESYPQYYQQQQHSPAAYPHSYYHLQQPAFGLMPQPPYQAQYPMPPVPQMQHLPSSIQYGQGPVLHQQASQSARMNPVMQKLADRLLVGKGQPAREQGVSESDE